MGDPEPVKVRRACERKQNPTIDQAKFYLMPGTPGRDLADSVCIIVADRENIAESLSAQFARLPGQRPGNRANHY